MLIQTTFSQWPDSVASSTSRQPAQHPDPWSHSHQRSHWWPLTGHPREICTVFTLPVTQTLRLWRSKPLFLKSVWQWLSFTIKPCVVLANSDGNILCRQRRWAKWSPLVLIFSQRARNKRTFHLLSWVAPMLYWYFADWLDKDNICTPRDMDHSYLPRPL